MLQGVQKFNKYVRYSDIKIFDLYLRPKLIFVSNHISLDGSPSVKQHLIDLLMKLLSKVNVIDKFIKL